ncbi:MAG: malto-oligosyltrehalose trehalohydrolase [Thermoleophilia bacterium]
MGAEVVPGGVHFRVWAPARERVSVVFAVPGTTEVSGQVETDEQQLVQQLGREADGYHAGFVPGIGEGTRYRFRLDGDFLYPDPASRFQPEGPHGPSQVVDPSRYRWQYSEGEGFELAGQVLYELHVGTFTPAGTWAAAQERLPDLADLGVTLLEVMPVADFPGEFGWGYDGVCLFAPTRLYGEPDDFRRFVDAAHGLGLGVLLDVVYNHLGPDGNYLPAFSPHYFTDRYETPWGQAVNFDGPESAPVREFFVANAAYWTREFRVDGLRLDAVHAVFDGSEEHIVTEITRTLRREADPRRVLVTLENEDQQAWFARKPERGGAGADGLWNDDFHHAAKVALSGAGDAYYTGFTGGPQELVSAARRGFLFQGQPSPHLGRRRGTPAGDLSPEQFIVYLDNHDQVANAGAGRRVHMLTDPGSLRALTAYLLLCPSTPLLFQGQEFAAGSPFHFFADHSPELAGLVREGREEFMSQFPGPGTPEGRETLPAPGARATFHDCKLDFSERETNRRTFDLHRDLLRLRKGDPVISAQCRVEGAVLGERAFLLRFALPGSATGPGSERLLVVNLGRTRSLEGVAEPLLAPPEGSRWVTMWSSEDPAYGGLGTPGLEREEGWWLPGRAAELLIPEPEIEEVSDVKKQIADP